jgi:hypothetical protein
MEAVWIPNNRNHHFAVPNHVFHFSGGSCLARTQTISLLVHKWDQNSSNVIKLCQSLTCADSKSLSNSLDRSIRICGWASVKR